MLYYQSEHTNTTHEHQQTRFAVVCVMCVQCSPEECVVLHSRLPQPLGHPVTLQLEAYCALKLLKLQQAP